MNYPLISEYVEAIKAAEDNFDQLKHLRPVLDDDGQPVMTGGNFAEVFKMKDEKTGKLYAVKCFLREQEGRAEAYRQIAEELEFVSSTFLTPIKYLDKELFVDTSNSDENEFPVLLMDWVEGQTLDKYIREHIDDEYELSLLAYQFSRLAMWLLPQPFAHGDLKPDNILVRKDGTLALVDYDGMYVPAMKGQKARELGSPDFRHPSRTEDIFDEHIDDFSLVSILLSLKAIALKPDLLEQYGASDRLLFSERDYRNLSESQVMDALKAMMQDTDLATLYSLFILSSAQNNLSQTSFRLLSLSRPQKRKSLRVLKITKPIVNTRKELIPFFQGKENVTHVICSNGAESYLTSVRSFNDEAFVKGACRLNTVENERKYLLSLLNDNEEEVGQYYMDKKLQGMSPAQLTKMKNVLVFFDSWDPETQQWVPSIGIADHTIQKKETLRTNVTEEDLANAWTDEYGVKYSPDGKRLLRVFNDNLSPYSVRNGTMVICDEAFSWVISAGYGAFEDSDNLTQIILPDSLVIIGERAFCGCKSLKEINIPQTIKKIGDSAFYMCESLQSINLPNTISEIGKSVFSECGFSQISIPNSINKIGNYAFYNCKKLQTVIIPDSVTQLGAGAFGGCSALKQVKIPDSITELGYEAFSGSAFSQIEIPPSITKIGSRAFWNSSLTQINIPDSVTIIEEGAFYGSSLEKIKLSNSITEIADSTFYDCFALKQISIPKSVTQIDKNAFYGCNALTQIELPDSIKFIGGGAFLYCESLTQIIIPDSVVELGNIVFSNCHSLKCITFSGVINKIGNDIFYGCDALEIIQIPNNSRNQFEEMLPDYKDILMEQDEDDDLSTEVTEEDLANAWTDKYGVIYSSDGKRLLKAGYNDEISGTKPIVYNIREGVEIICDGALHMSQYLEVVNMPNSVRLIGEGSFENCCNLKSVKMSNNITSIGSKAFASCFALQSIVIPKNVERIGLNPFAGSGITNIQCDSRFFETNGGVLYDKRERNLISICKGVSDVIVPFGVISIGSYAYNNKYDLNSVTLPESVKSIGESTFYDSSLSKIIIPIGLISIGDLAFALTNLTSIQLPSSITCIGEDAFGGCEYLQSIIIEMGSRTKFEELLPAYKDKLVER